MDGLGRFDRSDRANNENNENICGLSGANNDMDVELTSGGAKDI